MTKFFAACSLIAFSFANLSAEEIDGTIKKVDGNKITVVKKAAKGSPKGTKGEEVVLTTADKVKVNQATYNKKAKTYTTGDAITAGLQDPTFTAKKKNTKVHIITNADNKVTDILVLTKRKKTK